MAGPPTISCVIAAFNEAGSIGDVVRGIRASVPGLLEVVVVDDGSTDRTGDEAREAGARVLGLSPNRGKGIALREGIRAARGDALLFIDGDGQDDPGEAPRLVEALSPAVSMVVGSRFLGTFRERAITPLHWWGNRFLTGAFNVLFGTRLTDAQAGFRLAWRGVLDPDRMTAVRYEIEADLNLAAVADGRPVVDVPVTRMARRHGRSGFRSFYHGGRILLWAVRGRLRGPGRAP